MDRFVKLFSKILDWKHYKQPHYLQVFVALLFRANWKNSYDRSGREIKRGQAIISQREFCDDCGVTRNTLAKILNGLAESGEITIETNNNYSLITIVNYDKFQGENDDIEIVDKEEKKGGSISGSKIEPQGEPQSEPQGEPPIEPIIEYIEYNRNNRNSDDEEKKEKKEISSSSHAQGENQEFGILKADAINENKKSHSENGLAARANIEVSMPNYIKREDVGNWLIVETSTEWKESICREFQCGLKDLPWLFSQYSDELLKQGVEDKDERDIKKHFLSMMRIKRDVWNRNKIDPYKTNPNGISPQVDKLITMLYGE